MAIPATACFSGLVTGSVFGILFLNSLSSEPSAGLPMFWGFGAAIAVRIAAEILFV